jgi:hypothetical protein
MRNCDVPGHPSAPLAPWEPQDFVPAGVTIVDSCATGGGLGIATNGQMAGGPAGVVLVRPLGARNSIKFIKAVLWYAARLAGTGQPLQFWTTDYHVDGTFVQGISNGPPGSENLVAEQQLGPATNVFQTGIHCGQPFGMPQTGDPCFPAQNTPLLFRGMEVTLSEDVRPLVSQPVGTLVAGGPQSGVRTLSYAASDLESGLAKVDAMLDDTVVATHDFTTRCFYSDFTVCPPSQDETLNVDTRGVPNGSYRLTLRVQDAAGNVSVVSGASPIEVANTAPVEPTVAATFTLSAHFKGTARPTLVVPYARRTSLSGRLVGSVPVPAGATVEVLERVDRPAAKEVVVGSARTTADGSFSYILEARRPSRALRLAYRSNDGSATISAPMKLRVRAASSLHASLRGRVIHFSGRVRSVPVPSRGLSIWMEGRAPGSTWTSFAHLHTTRNGRFSGRYRLKVRRPGVTLSVRAVVRAQKNYPYVSARSRTKRLVVG